jgi:hypothetical protein
MVICGIQLMHRLWGQFLTIVMILSKFSTCKWSLCKVVNTLARLNTLFVTIYDLGMPRICLAKNTIFENYPSWLYHQARGSSHVARGMDNLLSKDNHLVTSALKDSSKDVPTPHMLPSVLNSSPWPKETHVSMVGFRVSKQVLRR